MSGYNEYKIQLSALLDANAKGDLQKQADAIKDLSVTISKLSLDKSVIDSLKKQLTENGIDINLVLGDTSQIQGQAKQVGQQIGSLINKNAESAINKVSSNALNKSFRIDPSTSKEFNSEMESLVSTWTKAKGQLTDIKIDTRTSFDKGTEANITNLHQATVTYKNELDEVIKKTIAWRQIGSNTNQKGEVEAIHGFVEVAGSYSKALDTIETKTNNFLSQQKRLVGQLNNNLSSIQSDYQDQNASRPIKSQDSVSELSKQYQIVENAIGSLGNATKTTFSDMEVEARKQITILKNMVKEYRNAENVSTKLKGVDFESGLSMAGNDLEKFKSDAKEFPQITKTIDDLNIALSKVGNADSLNTFNNQLRVARSELAKIKSETAATNRSEKVGLDVSGIKSKIADIQRISPEIDKFKTQINGAEVSIQSLLSDLSKVNTQGDFSVVNSKFKAFSDSAKTAGITISEVAVKIKTLDNDIPSMSIDITNVETNLKKLHSPTTELSNKIKQLSTDFIALNNISDSDKKVQAYSKLKTEISQVSKEVNSLNRAQTQQVNVLDKNKLSNSMTAWLRDNTKAAGKFESRIRQIQASLDSVDKLVDFNNLKKEFQAVTKEAQALGLTGRTLGDELKNSFGKFTQWFSVSQVVMTGVNEIKKFGTELVTVDTILTEISKTSDIAGDNLKRLGIEAYDAASKYGATAEGYLLGVQEMSRAGFDENQAKELSELSILAQSAGDMTAELANEYLIATNFAYGYEGSVSKLNAVLDAQNQITNRNALNLTDLANATKIAGSQSAQSGIEIDEMTAALGTMIAVTQRSGDTVARSFKGILMNLQQVSGKVKLLTLKVA